MDRRCHLRCLGSLLAASLLPWPGRASAADPVVIRLNLPGPRSLPFMPLEMIGPLGIDREMGVVLNLRYFTSGVLAFEDMMAGNAPFAGHGFAILPGMRQRGKHALAIASVADSAADLSILVRTDLTGKIPRVADLKYRSIGVSSGTANSKTYLQWIGEQVLVEHGVAAHEVRWVQSAQNWDSIRSVLASKSADAVMCEEPFASRAVNAGLARVLFSFKEMKTSQSLIGGRHLRAVVSRNPAMSDNEAIARLMVQMLQRSLHWLAEATPAAIVMRLGVEPKAERQELIGVLSKYQGIFSRDGRFSAAGLAGTAAMLQGMGMINQAAELDALIDDRWVGRRS